MHHVLWSKLGIFHSNCEYRCYQVWLSIDPLGDVAAVEDGPVGNWEEDVEVITVAAGRVLVNGE